MMSALGVQLILVTMKYSIFNFQDKFHTPTFTRGRLVRGSREAIGWRNRSSRITCKRHVANLPPLLFTERKPEATALKLKSLPLHRLHGIMDLHTLRAPFSGTFLQTLPDLVASLKGHSLSPRSCPSTRSAPSESSGTDKTVDAT